MERHSEKYLYHEFLETDNHPLYITDFVSLANQHGLQYLTDALLAFDNTQLLGQQRNAFLEKIENRLERLQYMDFMINQRFRRTLLCHQDQSIRTRFSPEHMTELAYRGKLSSKRPPVLSSEKTCHFYQGSDTATFITLSHPVSKAAVVILSNVYPSSIDYMDLLQQSCQQVANNNGLNYVKNISPFYQEFYLLLINDWISMDTHAHTIKEIDWEKPLYISALSWEYANKLHFLPNFLQQVIDIDELSMQALNLLRHGILRSDLLKTITKLHDKKKHFWNRNTNNEVKRQLNIFLDVLNNNHLLEQK